MPGTTKLLTPEEAWARIASSLEPRAARQVPRARAGGLALAADLTATVDMPPADVSAMDGYAAAGAPPVGAPLPVAGTAAAGRPAGFELASGEVCKIMTGAMVPAGADRVIPVEKSDGGKRGDDSVVFTEIEPAGAHIRRHGEVTRRGQPVLAAGAPLTPAAISLAAAHGYGELPVLPPPTVAVLVTGDEVVPPESEPGPGQLRDSNSAFLLAAGRSLGLEPRFLGIAPDEAGELRALVGRGLESEVLLLSGGVSMGEFDLVEDVLAELGCETLFDQVAIQPGKPLVVARHGGGGNAGGWVFGLPGNPASVMVTFWLFVRPLLRRLMGFADAFWHGALAAELAAPLPAAKDRDRFLAAHVRFAGGRIVATPRLPRGSHDVAAYARGSALARVRPGAPAASAGDRCEVLPLANWMDEA